MWISFFHAFTGEGPINVAGGQNRGQEVRVNGPIGTPGQMRMDVGFPMQQGPGNYIKHPSGKVFKKNQTVLFFMTCLY